MPSGDVRKMVSKSSSHAAIANRNQFGLFSIVFALNRRSIGLAENDPDDASLPPILSLVWPCAGQQPAHAISTSPASHSPRKYQTHLLALSRSQPDKILAVPTIPAGT
jgi:hypothetical protein